MGLRFQSAGINLEYEIIGTGDQVMFAFHGFSNTSDLFRVFEPSFGKKYTIYSFNLPYHGNSTIDEIATVNGISPEALEKYFKDFLKQIHQTEFSLLGFSIGGKVALKLIELFPQAVQHVYLFAPDGIRLSFWYKFITRTRTGKLIYRRLMQYPGRYMRIVDFLEKILIVPAHTANFVRNSLDTSAKREMVFETWMCLRRCDPEMSKVRKVIDDRNLDFHLFFGRYDKIIPAHIGEKFAQKLRNKNCLHILDSGHMLIKAKTNSDLELILST